MSVNKIEVDVDRAILDVFKKFENVAVKEVKKRVPVGNSQNKLQNNITSIIDIKEQTLTITCGDKYYIAHFVEFGTSKQRMQPFMRPAFDKLQAELLNELANVDYSKYIK